MHMHARGEEPRSGHNRLYYDSAYMHATVKMDSDSSPVSIDTEEIEQSTQSAKAGGRARDC